MKFRKMTAVLAACVMTLSAGGGMTAMQYDGMSLQAAASVAAEGTYGNLTYVSTGSAITITKCDVNATYEVVPEEIDGLPVTKIDSNAFENCTKLVGVIVPESVTNIGLYAFSGCTALSDVTLPESVTAISAHMFAGCTSLESLTLPGGTISIGYNAFDGCTALSDITLPDTVQTIGSAAFTGCTSLTEMAIPDAVLSVGDSAFEGCTALKTVKLGSAIKVLGGLAFADCSSLTAIDIPASVTTIGDGVFRNSLAMTSLTVNSANTKYKAVENVLFSADMTQLIAYPAGRANLYYTVPKTVTDIHDYAFYGNLHLTEITFPNTLATIGANAFYSDEGVTNIEKVFYYDSGTTVNKSIITDEEKLAELYTICDNFANAEANTVYEGNGADGKVVIYYGASGTKCASESVELGYSWRYVGQESSYNSLTGYYYTYEYYFNYGIDGDTGNIAFGDETWTTESLGGYEEEFEQYGRTIDLWAYKYDGTSYHWAEKKIYPDTSTSDVWSWFSQNEDVSLKYDVNALNYYYLDGDKLVEFYKSNGMLKYRTVEMPDTETGMMASISMGEGNDLSSEYFYYSASLDTTPNETDALSYESFTYHQYDSSMGICGYDTSQTTAVLPDKIDRLPVTAIEDMAFYGCNDLQSVTISDSVATIGEYAFYFNSELETVVIPYSVSSIDASAFAGCTDLKDVYYNGSEEEWAYITKGANNECLLNATIHFNSTGPEATTEPVTVTPGDVNQDGKVSIVDVIYLNKAIMGAEVLDDTQQTAADCDKDGGVTPTDSLMILKSLVKLITL